MSTTPSDLHPHHEDHPDMVSRAARRGLVLFLLYFSFYVAFLLMNVFAPEAMGKPSIGGPNLAIVMGVGLIFAAIILSLVYMWWTRNPSGEPIQ